MRINCETLLTPYVVIYSNLLQKNDFAPFLLFWTKKRFYNKKWGRIRRFSWENREPGENSDLLTLAAEFGAPDISIVTHFRKKFYKYQLKHL